MLQPSEALGNAAEACRRRGISRTQFYDQKRRFQTNGTEGLKDLPPIAKRHPNITPPEVCHTCLSPIVLVVLVEPLAETFP